MSGFNWQFLFLLLIFVPAVPVFAQEAITIEMDTDKDVYQDGYYITISGTVSKKQESNTLVGIYDPFGSPAGFYIADIVDGKYFSVEFLAKAGVNFKVDGTYSVTAFYAKTKNTITFDFVEKLESDNPVNETNTEQADTDTTDQEADTTAEQETDTTAEQETDTTTPDTNTADQEPDTNTAEADTTTPEQEVDTTTDEQEANTDSADQETNTAETNTTEQADTIITKNTEPPKEEKKLVEPINDKIIEKPQEKKEINKDTYDNLSVEDIEYGKMLNQINLRCDKSDLKFDISYYDGMGPSLTRLCKFQQSLSFYDQDLVENPDDPEVLSNKAAVLSKLGYYNEALVHLDAALDTEPTFVSALNNKANVLYEMGNLEEARDLYNQVLQIDPNHDLASKNLAYVDLYLANSKIQSPSLDSLTKNIPVESTDGTQKNIADTKPSNIFEQITSMFSDIAKSLFG